MGVLSVYRVKAFFKAYYLQSLLVLGALVCLTAGARRYWQSQAVLAAATDAGTCIVLDAGHGGEDGGASSQDGVLESGLNLEIVLRLRQLFALFGQETVLTRDGDYAIYDSGAGTLAEKKVSDLKNRVALVNGTPGALLLSIHQNYFGQSQYDGAQLFYGQGELSQRLAEALQDGFAEALGSGTDRRAKAVEDGVYLMTHVQAPAVLIECGFLSNAAECAKLQDGGYQKKMAALIVGTVLDQLTEEESMTREV